jgi:5-formyltetrahydrofolate cyclo-ligase
MQDKAGLRRSALHRRALLTVTERALAGEALERALAGVLGRAQRVAAFAAVGTEPPTEELFAHCAEVLLPVLLSDGELDWAAHTAADELRPGPHGLLEPRGERLGVDAIETCDLVLVPALAVDRAGNRLGRGGGSYDRALARTSATTIALLYDGELVEQLPVEPHDVPVRAVVTPGAGMIPLTAGGR